MPPKQTADKKKEDQNAKKAPLAASKDNVQRKPPVETGPKKPTGATKSAEKVGKKAPLATSKGNGQRKSPVETSPSRSADATTAVKVTPSGQGDTLPQTESKTSSIAVNKPSIEAIPDGADSAEQNVQNKSPDGLDQDALMQGLLELQEHIQADRSKQMAPNYLDALKTKVNKLTNDMDQLKNYCDTSQKQLETVMTPIKQITDKIFRTIAVPEATDEGHKKTLEELELEVRQKHLHAQLAKIDDELLRMSKIAIETEAAAVEATQACAEAVEVAKQIQEELEEKQRQEQELLKQKEAEKRRQEEKRLEEERKRIEEEKKEAALIKLREKEAKQWPLINLTIVSALDFDGGIGCIIRADPQYFNKSNVNCAVVDLQDAGFVFPDNEEVISNVIELSPTSTAFQLKCNLCIFIPHNLSRQQAASREPAIKVESAPGRWTEIPTKDTTLDKFRELKFVQGDVRVFCKLIVVSRFKKDHLKLKKRGGRFVSNVDPRVTFTTTPETFSRNEKVAVQMQPVDQFSMGELKSTMPEAKGLLTSSSVFSIEWESRTFGTPIVMTLPVPPNPVVAKKAAMTRSAKDSKGKPAAGGEEGAQELEKGGEAKEEVIKKEDTKALGQRSKGTDVKKGADTKKPPDAKKAADTKKAPEDGKKKPKEGAGKGKEGDADADQDDPSGGLSTKPIKWYMGQYATNTDDERDQFFILQMNEKKKRWVVEEIQIDPVKIDMIEMKLSEPIDRFVVFRTSLNLSSKEAERIADTLQVILVHRTVQLIVRQQMEDACDVMVYVAPISRLEKITRKLQDDDYDVGPEPSKEFNLKDGDLLELAFRGNVKCINQNENPKIIFNTNLDTKFHLSIQERDIYVQKSYDVYRGFIQMRKVTKVVTMPVRKKANTAMAAVKRTTENVNSEEGKIVDGSLAQVQEAPLKPVVEFKPVLLTEVLITFPKNMDLLAPKPLRKAPITYLPLNDPINIQVLTKIARELGSEWVALASTLGVKPVNLMILQRDAMLQRRSEFDQKFEMLLLWVKSLEKSEKKATILANALEAHGRDDLLRHLDGSHS